MKKKRLLAIALALSLFTLGAGIVLLSSGCGKGGGPTAAAKRHHCPMHPEVVKDGPGDCPICGMKLVPIEEEASKNAVAGAAPGAADAAAAKGPEGLAPVTIDAQKQQLLGLTTVAVKRAPFETDIRTTGRVTYDERLVHHVHTRYEAWVEAIEADYTGKYVHQGDVLVRVYSPELYATQKEYLLAIHAAKSVGQSSIPSVAQGGHDLVEAARQRLLLWDISAADIAALEKRGEPSRTVPLYAPSSGYVTGRTAFHGMKVMPADTLFDIVDLSSVWVIADVYEYELPRLSLGQHAVMTLSYWPGRSWNGRVTYVYPAVDEKTRTVKVRVEFANTKDELKPEMYAQVTIHGKPREALVVPDDVVLDSGTRKVVFVAEGEGRLSPRDVTVGDHADGLYEVTAGLAVGETVARGASFLVDSESRLKAALSAMTANGNAKAPTAPPLSAASAAPAVPAAPAPPSPKAPPAPRAQPEKPGTAAPPAGHRH